MVWLVWRWFGVKMGEGLQRRLEGGGERGREIHGVKESWEGGVDDDSKTVQGV